MNIYEKTLKKYGIDKQLIVLAEECSEVIKEVMKRQRYIKEDDNFTEDALCEEIADLEIILGSVRLIYGKQIDSFKEKKLERLAQRVNGDKIAIIKETSDGCSVMPNTKIEYLGDKPKYSNTITMTITREMPNDEDKVFYETDQEVVESIKKAISKYYAESFPLRGFQND